MLLMNTIQSSVFMYFFVWLQQLVENGYHNMDALDGSKSMLDIAKGKNIYEKLVCATIGTKPIEAIETSWFLFYLVF